MALLCQKHPTLLLDLDFAGSLEQVAVSCVPPVLKGKEEGSIWAQRSWREDPEAEPSLRISSELAFLHKFKLEERVEFELCSCIATICAVQKTLFLRKLYDMQYLKQNLGKPVQFSPLQACEMDSSGSDYTATDTKLLQLYPVWMQHMISFLILTRLSGVWCMEWYLAISRFSLTSFYF